MNLKICNLKLLRMDTFWQSQDLLLSFMVIYYYVFMYHVHLFYLVDMNEFWQPQGLIRMNFEHKYVNINK